MRRARRRLALSALAIFAVAALPAPVAYADTQGAAASSVFESIGGCFAAQKHVLLALVMDESASLGDAATQKPGTDPTARRVTAAQVAVDGIANLATQGTNVDVLLTGFSDNLHQYGTWQRLDNRSRQGIEQKLNAFRTRDQGLDTDFYTAMAGVQRALAKQAATLGTSPPCQLVLLFTDGRFDIDTHVPKPYDPNANDPKALKAALGIAALCSPNGPMQQLRTNGVRTITLALADPSAGAGTADPAFLQRLATGDCSTPGDQYGASFDATNAADLVGQFDAVATRLRGGTALAGDCTTPETLQIAPALRGLHIFADTGSAASNVVITVPGGRQVRISPQTGTTPPIAGVQLRATATGNQFLIIEATPAAGFATASHRWSGKWTIAFASSSAGAHCAISAFESWKPQPRKVTLQRGVAATIVFDMVDEHGHPTPAASLPSGARVVATLSNAATSATPIPLTVSRVKGQYKATVKLPESFKGQTATITATLHVSVAGTDIVSSPTATELAVKQAGFPAIVGSTLSLSSVTGAGVSHATIDVVGDAGYAGKVCIDRVSYPTLPPIPVADLVATPAGTCANVGPGGKATLGFTVQLGSQADGRVNGLIELRVTGVGNKHFQTAIPFTFKISRTVSSGKRAGVFVILLLAGIAAPLLILFFFGYRGAAFEIPDGLRAARIRVRVFGDGSIRRLEASGATPPLALEEADFDDAGTALGRARTIKWNDLEFRARSPRNPFGPPIGEVDVTGQYVTASDGVLRGGRRGTIGRVPLALPGTWVFALDPDGDASDEHMQAVDGTLSVFIAAGAPFVDQAPRVMHSLTDFFAELARRIDTRLAVSVS